MALGVAILANSRPYEGVLLCVPNRLRSFSVGVRENAPGNFSSSSPRHGAAALLLIVAGTMAYYNHRVFGRCPYASVSG